VSIVQQNATFTTAEAAQILGVSRQFIVNLLEPGGMPFHLVGTHRRMYARDLFRYRAQRDERRMRAIQEMGQKEVEAGTYFD
jgi:excisionase family DNA binding protein